MESALEAASCDAHPISKCHCDLGPDYLRTDSSTVYLPVKVKSIAKPDADESASGGFALVWLHSHSSPLL